LAGISVVLGYLNISACFFQLVGNIISLSFGNAFFDGLGCIVYQVFSFFLTSSLGHPELQPK
jgi:uncharacterized ion transporter superfamily protein YfcC